VAAAGLEAGDDEGGHGQDGGPDRQVDEEDPAPADVGQQPAEQRAKRGGDAGHGAPDAKRHAAFLALERLSQQRQ